MLKIKGLIGAGLVAAGLLLGVVAVAHHGENAALEEVMAADRDFAKVSREAGARAAWEAYFHPLGVQLSAGQQPVIGLASVLAGFDDWPEGAELDWYPVGGGIADSADLGFTWGRYVLTVPGEGDEVSESHGKYITVWQKQEDGSWKILADGGNSNPAPEE